MHGHRIAAAVRQLAEELRERIVVVVAERIEIAERLLLLGGRLHLAGDRDADHGAAVLRHDGAIVRRRAERNRLRRPRRRAQARACGVSAACALLKSGRRHPAGGRAQGEYARGGTGNRVRWEISSAILLEAYGPLIGHTAPSCSASLSEP